MPLRFRIADEIERLVDEFQIETWICRQLSHICLLGPSVLRMACEWNALTAHAG